MKRTICIALTLIAVVLLLTACGNTRKLERYDTGAVKTVTITTKADADKPDYTITKRKGVAELVDINNSAEFVETDKTTPAELKKGVLYNFKYYDFDDALLGECTISPDGYLLIKDEPNKVFLLKNTFDENALKETISLYDAHAAAK